MDIIVWISKSLYKTLILFILVYLLKLPHDGVYDFIICFGFSVSVFSSMPYSNQIKEK